MLVIGFDVAKDSLAAVGANELAEIQFSHVIPNSRVAVVELLERYRSYDSDLMAIAESTADYHRPAALACLEHRVPFRLINPILTKQFTRATVRKKKTDLTDAHILTKLALQGEGQLVDHTLFSNAKPLSRTANTLSQARRSLKLVHDRFASILPQETELLSRIDACLVSLDETTEAFRARASKEVDRNLETLLRSVPGVGPTIATILIAEIGTIDRFPSPDALVAYAGLDPKVRQSGVSLNHNTGITKRGSSTLRTALFLAASIARQHDPELKAYYQKKRDQGRMYREATVATARKLLRIIYAVWKRNTPYTKKEAS